MTKAGKLYLPAVQRWVADHVCIAANDAFGRTTGGERLEGLVAEYDELAARSLPA